MSNPGLAARENTNCLAGMRCPKCGALEPYSISLICWLTIYDDGTDFPTQDVRWTDDSGCECLSCHYLARVRDFLEAERTR